MYNFSKDVSGYGPRSMQGLLDAMQLLAVSGQGNEAAKRLLTIRSVQWGLDLYFMWKARGFGVMYKPNGGHAVGRYLAPVVAAALMTGTLGSEMKTNMKRVNNGTVDKCGFDIPAELSYWPDTGKVLYGYVNMTGCGEFGDYTSQVNANYVDPSHVGDNGRLAVNAHNTAAAVSTCAGAYQPVTSGPTQSTANLIRAIPAARAIAYTHMLTYIDRMMEKGNACRADQTPSKGYVQTFGRCVAGTNAGEQCRSGSDCPGSSCSGNTHQYSSWLARNLWEKYKGCYDNKTCPGMSGL
jgi:hypothetical protein